MPPGSHGPPIYKIQGEIHHRIGPLLPEPGAAPVYSQLYVYDHADALRYRTRRNPQLNHQTMDMLQSVLECCNPYVDVYQQAFNLSENTTLPEYRIQLDFRKGSDRR